VGCYNVRNNESRRTARSNVSHTSLNTYCQLISSFNIRYEAQLEKDWKYVIEDSDSKVLVVATDAIYQKVKDYPGKVRINAMSHI
jgi:hypothetical protein